MHPHFPSDSDSEQHARMPFYRHKSIHRHFGGGQVADILLWKNRNLSAGILAGATLMWFLFNVVEYNIIPLLCQIAMLAMLVIFIWSNAAQLLDRAPPSIPETIISEHAFREMALTVHYKVAYSASVLYDIACGKDLKRFLLVVGSLLVLSAIGSSCRFTSLLYIGFLCAHTLPVLYQRYKTEVDHLVAKGSEDIKKFYYKVDSNLLNKIPRGPVKTKVK
ncbi:reticulon-like protein B9 [Oryza brachyantha]|uniref:Reticulon-like protein n=1 Tax=Oryza brachyantha TaxID=4533 RepID=J3L334_ORYBR|nr:reticulon-like protein B9 [Oryza brachyantha]